MIVTVDLGFDLTVEELAWLRRCRGAGTVENPGSNRLAMAGLARYEHDGKGHTLWRIALLGRAVLKQSLCSCDLSITY